MGLEFEKLCMAHLGANAEDGVSVVDEIEQKMRENAILVLNDMFDGKAKITLTIDLARTREEGLVVHANVTEARPKRQRVGRSCFMADGEVMIEKSFQLPLPMKKRVERADIIQGKAVKAEVRQAEDEETSDVDA